MKSISKSKNPFQKVKLDLSPPNKPKFLKKNMSKKIHEQRRIQAIEHDNRILLKKMADIMMPRKSHRLQEFLPGVRLTPGGAPVVDNFVSSTKKRKGKKKNHTLGGLARKREMERIINENLAMLDRINKSKTSYSKRRLGREFANSRVYKNLCSVENTAGFLSKGSKLPNIRAQTSPGRSRSGLRSRGGLRSRSGSAPGSDGRGAETTTLAFEKQASLSVSDGSAKDFMVKIYAETSARNPLVQVTIETRPVPEEQDQAQDQPEDTSSPEQDDAARPSGGGSEGDGDGGGESDSANECLVLTITSNELKFFVPVSRRQQFFARENMPELFDFLLSRVEVAKLDDGASFLHIAPCSDEERVSIGLEPIIVHRSVAEVPEKPMSESTEPSGERVAMVLDTVFRNGQLKITGFDMDNHIVYECPQKVKFKPEIVELGRDADVVARLVPTLVIKVSSAQRGKKVLVLDTSGASGPPPEQ